MNDFTQELYAEVLEYQNRRGENGFTFGMLFDEIASKRYAQNRNIYEEKSRYRSAWNTIVKKGLVQYVGCGETFWGSRDRRKQVFRAIDPVEMVRNKQKERVTFTWENMYNSPGYSRSVCICVNDKIVGRVTWRDWKPFFLVEIHSYSGYQHRRLKRRYVSDLERDLNNGTILRKTGNLTR